MYCRKKLLALSENGWFKGKIERYNENICIYHNSFEDGLENCIDEDDINMVEVIDYQNNIITNAFVNKRFVSLAIKGFFVADI